MMNNEQQKIIIKYLKDKNLAEDIRWEVLDHMLHQIEWEMEENHIGFEEAFEKVKILWRKDLEGVWGHYFYKIPRIQSRRVLEIIKNVATQSMKISAVIVLLLLLVLKMSGGAYFQMIYPYYVWSMVVLMFVGLVGDVSLLWKMSFYRNLVSTDGIISPLFIGFFSVIMGLQLKKLDNIEQIISLIYQGDTTELILLFLILFGQTFQAFYVILASRKYRQDLKQYIKHQK